MDWMGWVWMGWVGLGSLCGAIVRAPLCGANKAESGWVIYSLSLPAISGHLQISNAVSFFKASSK